MVRWLRWHCPPDTGFEIRALAVWGRARYLSVTEAPHNTNFHTWMGKKQFCFFQTAETGNRTPDSGVKGSGANHYPRAPAPLASIFAYNNDNVSFFYCTDHMDLFYIHLTTQSIRSKQKAFFSIWHYTWLDNGEQFCALSFHCWESREICRTRTDSALPTRISSMGSSPFHDPVLSAHIIAGRHATTRQMLCELFKFCLTMETGHPHGLSVVPQPRNAIYRSYLVLMLGHCLRRWANINPI